MVAVHRLQPSPALGHDVCVLQGAMPWDPRTLERAMGGGNGDTEIEVVDCEDFSNVTITQNDFFTG